MREFAGSVLDILLERRADELIGALFIGLAMSLCLCGIYMLVRRKSRDVMSLLTGLFLLASVASASMAAGFLRYRSAVEVAPSSPSGFFQHRSVPGWESLTAEHYVRMADLNRDGLLSAEEKIRMADRMVERARRPGVESGPPGVLAGGHESGSGARKRAE